MYNILWLDDEFVVNGKAHALKEDLEKNIYLGNKSGETYIEVCASYERFAQYIKSKTPNVVILDIECYNKEDDIQRNESPCASGFCNAKDLAVSLNIPIIVFTGKYNNYNHDFFSYSVQNCAYVLQKIGTTINLYEALFEGYEGKKAVLVGNRYPDYPFFDTLLDHRILPIEGVIPDQLTSTAIQGILNEYELLSKVTERDFKEVQNNNVANIRTIVEYIFNNCLIEDFANAIPFPFGNTPNKAFKFANLNNFTLGLWYQHKPLGNDIIPDEVKLALAYVWDGSCSFLHPIKEIYTPPIFKHVIESLQVKRMIFDSFIIVMKWFTIYKMNNMAPKDWNQLQPISYDLR